MCLVLFSLVAAAFLANKDVYNERMTEDDHITPALLTEVIIIIIIILCYRPTDRVKIDRQDGHRTT